MQLPADREVVKAAVVGLGYVGSCVAGVLADCGVEVVGIDTDGALVDELRGGHCRFNEPGLPELLAQWVGERLEVTTDYAAVRSADVVIVAVGTPVQDNGLLIETQLRSACERLSEYLRAGQLVIFKSTVPPGTTRRLALPALERNGLRCEEDFGLAFCPERLSEGAALRELRSFPIVVGGFGPVSSERAAAFWQQFLHVDVIPCGSLEVAELVKLADNWWIDHNIAMANELARLSAVLDIDVLDVITAANSIPKGNGKVNILLPSVGVGGSCLTKDPWMLWRAAQEHGVELRTIPAARDANDAMPRYTVELILEELRKHGKRPVGAKVAVLGLAFKNNTGDLRKTPTLPVVTLLREAGVEIQVFDPLVGKEEVEETFGLTPAGSVWEAVTGADCVAALAWHKELEGLDFTAVRSRAAAECVVIDGRAYFSKEKVAELRSAGFVYRGIGR